MRRSALLATDLDRTLIPNGEAPESPGARELLAAWVEDAGVELVYVTGRSLALVEEAIERWKLPPPHHVLADVGSSLYRRVGATWRLDEAWERRLSLDWPAAPRARLAASFADEPELTLQEPAAQRPFKQSFYSPLEYDVESLRQRVLPRLERRGLRSVIVFSVDEAAGVGLVDVLPKGGTKRGALELLIEAGGWSLADVLFAGDSGNDLEVLVSSIPSVLVANADDALRERVRREAEQRGNGDRLHLARGGVLELNGNYAAGILEGWLHFHPDDRGSIEQLRARRR